MSRTMTTRECTRSGSGSSGRTASLGGTSGTTPSGSSTRDPAQRLRDGITADGQATTSTCFAPNWTASHSRTRPLAVQEALRRQPQDEGRSPRRHHRVLRSARTRLRRDPYLCDLPTTRRCTRMLSIIHEKQTTLLRPTMMTLSASRPRDVDAGPPFRLELKGAGELSRQTRRATHRALMSFGQERDALLHVLR